MTRLLIVGGSDAGISAGLRARELAPEVEVTLVVGDAYPNYSVCGIPYYLGEEVPDWRSLAHRTRDELEAAGLELLLEHTARRLDPSARRLAVSGPSGADGTLAYDVLVVATGARPVQPPIAGLDALGPGEGVHLVHTMDDALAIAATLSEGAVEEVLIVGAGFIGIEMAEAFVHRGLGVTLVEALPEVLPTVDADLGRLVRDVLEAHHIDVITTTKVTEIRRSGTTLVIHGTGGLERRAQLVLIATGVRPDTELAARAGATLGAGGAIAVDRRMRTNLPNVFGAGDCVETYHRILDTTTYLPLGTTAHKQGRIAGENAVGGDRCFAGSVGTQVVRVFDTVVARTGLRAVEAEAAGWHPLTSASTLDDHKAYYPGARTIEVRITGDVPTGRLLGLQMLGNLATGVAKRIDTAAAALHHRMNVGDLSDLDLSYTPPLGSPWDAMQSAAQQWQRASTSHGS
jgi:NADPH-dependent 2,4-dienoyl-CoA reductase/sulfur reductase-like enzyme